MGNSASGTGKARLLSGSDFVDNADNTEDADNKPDGNQKMVHMESIDDIQMNNYGHDFSTTTSYEHELRNGSVAQYVKVSRALSDAARPHVDEDKEKSGVAGAVFNFTNSIVGAGIIGLPHAIKRTGFWFGIILLAIVAGFTDWSVRYLVSSGARHHKKDYELICEWIFGKKGYYAVTIFMFLNAYGAMIAYHVVIGDTIPKVIQYYWPDVSSPWDTRWFVVTLFSIFFMLPLSLYKHMASLSFTSFLSIGAVIFIIISVCIESTNNSVTSDVDHSENLPFIRSTWFAGAGTMAFAFVCQHSTFIVYDSLEEQNMKRWFKVSHYSVSLSFVLCIILASVGYLAFRDDVDGDILNNFEYSNGLINIARIMLAMTMVFTFPMEQFVARHCVLEVSESFGWIKSSSDKKALYICTLCLWSSALALGASLDDLGIVLELVGAFAASFLAFIMPGFVILKANPERMENKCSFDYLMCIILIVFGLTVMILGTASVFMD